MFEDEVYIKASQTIRANCILRRDMLHISESHLHQDGRNKMKLTKLQSDDCHGATLPLPSQPADEAGRYLRGGKGMQVHVCLCILASFSFIPVSVAGCRGPVSLGTPRLPGCISYLQIMDWRGNADGKPLHGSYFMHTNTAHALQWQLSHAARTRNQTPDV